MVNTDLALFDFDGTITNEDTFTRFVLYSTSAWRLALICLVIWPIVILFALGLFPPANTRKLITKVVFWNRASDEVFNDAHRFTRDYIPKVVRKDALSRIQWHKARGDMVYVVSASINPYLQCWCKLHGLQLLCSELQTNGTRLTGDYVDGDCSGSNKVKAIKQAVDVSGFKKIFAYGDTLEDIPMLLMAEEKYFRWQKIA